MVVIHRSSQDVQAFKESLSLSYSILFIYDKEITKQTFNVLKIRPKICEGIFYQIDNTLVGLFLPGPACKH